MELANVKMQWREEAENAKKMEESIAALTAAKNALTDENKALVRLLICS